MIPNEYSPAFVRNLDAVEKENLSVEIRQRILSTVSENGGHLASNLGAVELTVSLHSVLDMDKDKLLFDVGHQCYAHKLLTGRAGEFSTLRKLNGISGFSRTSESPYDFANSGHASDALSVALGYARARDLKGDKSKIAVVLGDGALTGGMCFEALNDAGHRPTQMLIVLNDNEMSISKNVGAISKYLTHLRQSKGYHSFKSSVKNLLFQMPEKGKGLYNVLSKLKKTIKTLLLKNDMVFEALGAEYLGPLDGHNIAEMEKSFAAALKYEKPVIVHVLTQKGKGYKPAEDNPGYYHGTEPFNIATGLNRRDSVETCGKTAIDRLCELADKDDRIVCITAAMPSGTCLDIFAAKYPDRCFDVGIAEEHAAALAGGLGMGGLKPCLALYSTFLQRAYDQISIDICLNKAPVLLLIDRSGVTGSDGETHQGINDVALLRTMPGMIIACPSSKTQLKQMIDLGIASDKPFAIRYPKHLSDISSDTIVETGKWITVKNGTGICVIASGRMVQEARNAALLLVPNGITPGIIDACFIKPLDTELLSEIVKDYDCILTLEDNVISGGLGESVRSCVGMDTPVYSMSVPDQFIPAGTTGEQLEMCGLSSQFIYKKIIRISEEINGTKSR